jgi:hypothetical protein
MIGGSLGFPGSVTDHVFSITAPAARVGESPQAIVVLTISKPNQYAQRIVDNQ